MPNSTFSFNLPRLIVVTFLLFFCHQLNGQNYVPLVRDSVAWKEQSTIQLDLGSYTGSIFFYYILGDTTINNTTYSKLQKSDTLYKPVPAVGFIREFNKQVYLYIPELDSSEILLYDFNLNIGDTMAFADLEYRSLTQLKFVSATLTSIDSIQIENGSYRKRHNFSTATQSNFTAIVEGIGNTSQATSGLLQTIGTVYLDYTHSLDCMILKDTVEYRGGYYQFVDTLDCFTIATNAPMNLSNRIESRMFSIYPNPTSSRINISPLQEMHQYEVNVFNDLGQLVSSASPQNKTITIDTGNWRSGLYLVCFKDQFGAIMQVEKIVLLD